ncbi:MAG: tryptophan synthase subunit beta [Syntrophomonadaceae bacterium]|nr:tryptophan synthase subunit beta [Syntrophomonadaceae bacterium]
MLPNLAGYFGEYGGRFVPEALIPALEEIEKAYKNLKDDINFKNELSHYLKYYVGRPSPLYYAKNLSEKLGGAKIYLKREDLNHTGSHKINNTMGQALLAKRMGKTRLIAETGAGQHGVATATAAAALGLKCTVYMGATDAKRQGLNLFRMEILGAEVVTVNKGSKTLKDAANEAFRDFISSFAHAYMMIGSAIGPHPYPMMVRNFQSVIGYELKEQLQALSIPSPDYIIACVGGGSNAIGIFYPYLNSQANLIGIEAGGKGEASKLHCATLARGDRGILHGALSYLLQDENGLVEDTHSIAAGLDYPGVGPEHAYLKDSQKVTYYNVSDEEAVEAFITLSRHEGIIPALESAHALAYALKLAPSLSPEQVIVINISGRGDKDAEEVSNFIGGVEFA